MELNRISIHTPSVEIFQKITPTDTSTEEKTDSIQTSLYDQFSLLGDRINIRTIELTEGNLDFTSQQNENEVNNQKVSNTDFSLQNIALDNENKTFTYENIHLYSENLSIPIDNGFYTLDMETVELEDKEININRFHLNPLYSKTEFAYRHPKHQDWFDVIVDRVNIQDIDLPAFFLDTTLTIGKVTVDNPELQNFKNKQIYVPPKWMPMLYESIQKAPVPIDIQEVKVSNLKVIYEELAKNKTEPGKLVFTELNGVLTGVTNIVSYPEQYMRLDADGKLYGEGHFNAVWLLPVDSLNDRFILEAYLPEMDLTLLNEMIAPLATARLAGGEVTDLYFLMDAGSVGGSIDMLLLYEGLKVDIFKIQEGEIKSKKFLNFLVNAVVRNNNPNTPGNPRSKARHSYVVIKRDPYHSTFNYLWQLLRPAVTESVGISKTEQKIAGGIGKFFTKIKNTFSKKSDPKEK
ncbi:MAG: hypothetical protein LIP01_07200 [Tannerellaceae bacterium]|nr:hypothetical protein [Tannerellaceae bacterium]